jgi:demethylmenaquinone methyltransferase/2-methoxy-6-polyprenyl-1,4-benzoquinol methylase
MPFPPGTRPQGARDEKEAARAVRQMFARIVPRYDFLNRLLSFSYDVVWRRRTAQQLAPRLAAADARALDLCCGTGDLTLALARVGRARVVGVDFVAGMLHRAKRKAAASRQIAFVEGDALQLPFAEATFDAVTAAFGFRNLASYEHGLEEIRRILKPGGEAAILEFVVPRQGMFAAIYGVYFRRLLPHIGRWLSGEAEPYRYLPASVETFPEPEEFLRWMETAGFRPARMELWTGGTVALYRGTKA